MVMTKGFSKYKDEPISLKKRINALEAREKSKKAEKQM